jgi:hypothetical protein
MSVPTATCAQRRVPTNASPLNLRPPTHAYAVPGSPYLALLACQKRVGISTNFVPHEVMPHAIADLSQGRL